MLLDLGRRIGGHGQSVIGGGDQDCGLGLSDGHGSFGVPSDEGIFDGDDVRAVAPDELRDLVPEVFQSLGQRVRGAIFDGAVVNCPGGLVVFQHGVPGDDGAGVDAHGAVWGWLVRFRLGGGHGPPGGAPDRI